MEFKDIPTMVETGLCEDLKAAEYCINYDKSTEPLPGAGGLCLGFPAAVLLFAIVDTMGSYFYKSTFAFRIDGHDCAINEPSHFFRVLNGKYFGLQLSGAAINAVYSNYRGLLTHNAVLVGGHAIEKSNVHELPFIESRNSSNEPYISQVNLIPLHKLCERAIPEFVKDLPTILSGSQRETEILSKKEIPSSVTSALDQSKSASFIYSSYKP